MQRTVKIDMSATCTGTVEVDGTDLSKVVNGATIECRVGQLARVQLSLVPLHGADFSGVADVRVSVSPELRSALVFAGWTPPQEHPLGLSAEQCMESAVGEYAAYLACRVSGQCEGDGCPKCHHP